ncbi:MAG: hypothetical protein ACUVRE_08185 [Thermoanaerobaculaceae bacterium]
MLAPLLLMQALLQPATPDVGLLLAVDDPGARAVLRESLERELAPAKVTGSCRGTAVCVEVTGLPIIAGTTKSGWAIAARVSRRLGEALDWPEEVPRDLGSPRKTVTVEIIEDTTASGELACLPCEEEKAQLKRALTSLVSFAGSRYQEVGGLGLWVGPYQDAFLRQVSKSIANQYRQALASGGEP